MKIGYARVSTVEQNLDLQLDALQREGCDKIFHDKLSGVKADRPGLTDALTYVRAGDTLVVWRLDRLGRSLRDLILRVEELEGRGIKFKSIQDSIDTSTAAGELQFHMIAALAQFERSLIQERTNAGLAAARARGKTGGRPQSLSHQDIQMAASLMKDRTVSIHQICERFQIGRTTLYKYVSPNGEIRKR